MNIGEAIINFLSQPVYEIAARSLIVIVPIVIFGFLVFAMAEVWLYWKQGEYGSKLKWNTLAVSVPQDAVNTPKGMENFFNNLAGSKSAITWKEKWFNGKFQAYFSFEIVSDGGRVTFYIRCINKYRDLVEAALYAQYPEAQILEVEDYAKNLPMDYPNDEYDLFGSEMVLRKPDFYPIKTYESFEHQGEKDLRFKDPLLPMLEAMGKMRPGETYMIQIIIMQPNEQDWRKAGEKFIMDSYGKEEETKSGVMKKSMGWMPEEILNQVTGAATAEEKRDNSFAMFKITPQEKDLIDAINKKISKLGWKVKIRFVYIAKKELFRKGTIAAMTKGIFHQYGYLGWNRFGIFGPTTTKDDYPWQEWAMPGRQRALISNYVNRGLTTGSTPGYLNSEELATIFHFPAADARTPVLTTMGARRAEAPVELEFAEIGAPDLPNLDRTQSDVDGESVAEDLSSPLAVPKLTSPTGVPKTADQAFDKKPDSNKETHEALKIGLPVAGMPAPLPPGLDVADSPIKDDNLPNNLPL